MIKFEYEDNTLSIIDGSTEIVFLDVNDDLCKLFFQFIKDSYANKSRDVKKFTIDKVDIYFCYSEGIYELFFHLNTFSVNVVIDRNDIENIKLA
ncbi:MAG: hypothetical protein LC122_02475 [Chitinophagales bacterium]|nr:hypothetical protein [Chitinophagales bacterium]